MSDAISGSVPEVYIRALCQEIAAYDGPGEARSVFFGGGTPSLLSPAQLDTILRAVQKRFRLRHPEITMEANPDDVTKELLEAWRGAGVNRISLGVQSFNEETLNYLGRRHDAASARRACAWIASQFDNWNMDLIFGAPPLSAWPDTLAECRAWAPPHVAAYGLTYEEGTPFGARRHEALDADASLLLFQQAETALADYMHYEISNFACSGRESRHNLIYWHNGEYAGFGTGAYSFIGGVRARNIPQTTAYMAAPGKKTESLALRGDEIRLETLIQYFRLRAGLTKAEYRRRFGRDMRQDFAGPLDALIARGLLQEDEHAIRPTPEGFYLNNEIGLALVG